MPDFFAPAQVPSIFFFNEISFNQSNNQSGQLFSVLIPLAKAGTICKGASLWGLLKDLTLETGSLS